ncbi:hypothetical protein V8B97DRAFT_2022414 [Scleroderma yunnanense]
MFSLNTSDSSFNFSSGSSFPLLTSDPLLALPTDCANDNMILPPLQNNSLSLVPAQQQSFVPYLTNSLINQVNSAYIQELQLTFLQDQCNTLKRHLVKVTTECDTIKNLFDQLASVVKSTSCDTSLLILTMMDEKPPTCEMHPNNFDNWLNSTEAEGSDCGIYVYLEEENGKVLSLHAGWRELTQSNAAPETWGKAKNRWKLEYICTKMYPAWSKHYLDKNGKLKCGTCDAVKEEALDKPKENYKLSSKKVKGQAMAVDTIPAAHPPKPITLPHTQSCRPSQPTDHAKVCKSTMAQSNPQQACIAPVVEENALVVSHSNITQPVVLYNPMGLLAMAAMKVKIVTVPPIPELPQLNPNGQKDNFCMYYDKTLTLVQCEAYDTEAKQLVKMNGWTKVIIKLGMLY